MKSELINAGHTSCAGCGEVLAIRMLLRALGKNTIFCQATGCMEITTSPYPTTAWNIPWIHVAFENAAAVASGVRAALDAQGKKDINVVAIGGDGGMMDIGFQAVSGVLERGEKVIVVATDNEAYMNCLSLDSLVMAEDGLKRITEVNVGDMVYAFNQDSHQLVLKKCTAIADNGVKDVFELNTLHHTIKATSNHPFLVLKRGKKSEFVWKELKEVKKGDEVVVLKKLGSGKSFGFKPMALSKKGDYKVNKINEVAIPKISSPELMEFLGLYVGDGWARAEKAETGFALPAKKQGRDKLLTLCEKIFGVAPSSKDENYVYIYSTNIAHFIDSLGFGKGARNKIVPAWAFTLPQAEKEAFVRGLMLSDGYSCGKSNRYVSASYDLLRTLRLLLQIMGYRVGKIHQQTKKKGTLCVYRQLLEDSTYGYICFSKPDGADFLKYPSQVKQRDFLADNEHFSTEKVTAVRFVRKEPTLDLRVDGEHNFIADGIVVHNTGIQRSSGTPLFASTTTSPAGKVLHGKQEWKKDILRIAAAHDIPYAASASIAYPQDLEKKAKKAAAVDGPSFLHIYSSCPVGWGSNSAKSIEIAKAAVTSGIWTLMEIENGVEKLSVTPSFTPVEDYFKPQKRFSHLTPEDVAKIKAHLKTYWKTKFNIEMP